MTALPASRLQLWRALPAPQTTPSLSRWLSALAGTLVVVTFCLQAGWPARTTLATAPWLLIGTYGALCLVAPSRAYARPLVASRRRVWALGLGLTAATAVAAGLRLVQLGSRSLWLDEAISFWAARLPWSSLYPTVARHDDSPPLYFALLHLWLTFGDGEPWMRALSVLCSLAAVVLGGLLAYRLAGPIAGVLAGLLLAISSVQVSYAQEARMYALVAALTPAVILLALRTLDAASSGHTLDQRASDPSATSVLAPRTRVLARPGFKRGSGGAGTLAGNPGPALGPRTWPKWAVAWGLSLAALAAAHHTAALVAAGTGAGAALVAVAALARGERAPAKAVAVAALVAGVAWSPLLPLFIAQTRHVAAHYWIPKPTPAYAAGEILAASIGAVPAASHIRTGDALVLRRPVDLVYGMLTLPRAEPLRQVSLAMSGVWWTALPALGAFLLAGLAAVRARAGGGAAVILAAAVALPVFALLVVSQVRPLFIARAMMGSGTLALVLAAVACAWLPRGMGAAAVALVVCLQLLGLGEQWWYPFTEEWRPAVDRLAAASRPADLVLVEGRWSQLPLDYYLRRYPGLALEEHGVPVDFGVGGKPEPVTSPADVPRIQALTTGRDRAWLVVSHAFDVDPSNLARQTLEAEFACYDVWPFQAVSVALFWRC